MSRRLGAAPAGAARAIARIAGMRMRVRCARTFSLLLCFGECSERRRRSERKQVEVLIDAAMHDGRHPHRKTVVLGWGLCFVFVNVATHLVRAPGVYFL